MTTDIRRALGALILMLLAGAGGHFLVPTKEKSSFPDVQLQAVVPERFGDWEIDRSLAPLLPDPTTLAAINDIYSDTLARTYVNSQGQRVMLMLAYGRRQSDTMRVHRPEGCYMGQGFSVLSLGQTPANINGLNVMVSRLDTRQGARTEPVSYWMVIGGVHVNTLSEMKRVQLRFGLRGYLADGLLFRVSSISAERDEAYRLHDQFSRDLAAAVPESVRIGLVGL